MGAAAKILLVAGRGKTLALLLAGLLVSTASAPGQTVQAGRYGEFWLWGGVDPARVMAQAKKWYVLQGFVSAQRQQAVFARQGAAAVKGFGTVVLTYRLNALAWDGKIQDTVLNHIQAWEYRGNTVWGIQLDFDARTKNLDQYAAFLRQVRQSLPVAYRLSVTGLLDWASQGDAASLESLRGVVDEIIFQTYQGRRTIADYPAYLRSLAKLRIPFKIGLVENGAWDWRQGLAVAQSPYYQGAVVFLLPEKWRGGVQ